MLTFYDVVIGFTILGETLIWPSVITEQYVWCPGDGSTGRG